MLVNIKRCAHCGGSGQTMYVACDGTWPITCNECSGSGYSRSLVVSNQSEINRTANDLVNGWYESLERSLLSALTATLTSLDAPIPESLSEWNDTIRALGFVLHHYQDGRIILAHADGREIAKLTVCFQEA